MKNKNIIIVLLIIAALYVIIAYAANSFYENNKKYLIISPNAIMEYTKNGFNVLDDEQKTKVLKNQKFSINTNNILTDNVSLTFDEYFKIGDEFLYSDFIGTKNIEIIDYDIEEITESDLIKLKEELLNIEISNYGELGIEQKIKVDLNNDGSEEIIYNFSNVFTDEEADMDFSLVMIEENNKISIIFKKIEKRNSIINSCASTVLGIIDIDSNKTYDIVISCTYSDLIGTDYEIYDYYRNKSYLIK